jgi:hypothetical protein
MIPPEFEPIGQYTLEQKEKMDKQHKGDFLWSEERKLMHHFMMLQNKGFAWEDQEQGRFREDFFPPINISVIAHKPWILKNIPIPPGLYPKVCRIIKAKIDAGVYEASNSSYRSRWFCVLKKDGKSLQIVHSLEENDWDLRSQLVSQFIIPTTESEIGVYTENHRTKTGKLQDERLPVIKKWLVNPL